MPFFRMPDGEELFVRIYGEGQPVLVLSGLGMLSWQWAAFLYPHKHKFRFIIPEWRGFGQSSQCRIPETDAISSHWADVRSLTEQLALENIIVIGYSMGATTTMHGLKYGNFAEQIKAYLHIDQTPKITVDDTWAYGLFGAQHQQFKRILKDISELLASQADYHLIQEMEHSAREQLAKLWLQFIQLQNNQPQQLKALQWCLRQPKLQSLLLPSKRIDYMSWYINNYLHHDEDYRQAIQQLKCPVTFFSGVQSKLYSIVGQTQIAQSIPSATQIRFEHSGHTPLLTEPVKFAKQLTHFLQQQHKSKQTAA